MLQALTLWALVLTQLASSGELLLRPVFLGGGGVDQQWGAGKEWVYVVHTSRVLATLGGARMQCQMAQQRSAALGDSAVRPHCRAV